MLRHITPLPCRDRRGRDLRLASDLYDVGPVCGTTTLVRYVMQKILRPQDRRIHAPAGRVPTPVVALAFTCRPRPPQRAWLPHGTAPSSLFRMHGHLPSDDWRVRRLVLRKSCWPSKLSAGRDWSLITRGTPWRLVPATLKQRAQLFPVNPWPFPAARCPACCRVARARLSARRVLLAESKLVKNRGRCPTVISGPVHAPTVRPAAAASPITFRALPAPFSSNVTAASTMTKPRPSHPGGGGALTSTRAWCWPWCPARCAVPSQRLPTGLLGWSVAGGVDPDL